MSSALLAVAGGATLGTALAASRRDGWQDVMRLAPAIAASAALSYLFALLIWPVLPLVWQAGAEHEAIGGFAASLLPGLVGALVDPEESFYGQARGIAWIGCAFVGICFTGYPFVVNFIG